MSSAKSAGSRPTAAHSRSSGSSRAGRSTGPRSARRTTGRAGRPVSRHPSRCGRRGGGFTARVDGEQVRAYAWAELADPDPTLDPAAVGTLVARLHRVRHPWPTSKIDPWFEAPIGRAGWKSVLEASRAAGAPYADRLAELLPALLEIAEILTPMRPVQTCHLDLWADNLRRSDGRPVVIDFDNAGPGDPSREIAMVTFEFGRGDAVRQRALYDAYVAAGGPGRVRDRDDLGLAVAQLHHIGHRHLTMWVAASDAEARARSLAGIDEFLAEPLLLPVVDALLEAVAQPSS
ncbi:MAG TPA: phosphotransferase [Gaiellaceae bacterium]